MLWKKQPTLKELLVLSYFVIKNNRGEIIHKLKRMNNFYLNGRKKMCRTWSSTGKKTDQQNYYNQVKLVKSVDYSYYSNGRVKDCIKHFSNEKLKQRSWYYSTGKLKKVKNY